MIDLAAVLCLTAAIYHEARGEPVEGQMAVALVVLNRAREPERICTEVGRRRQFSFNPRAAVVDRRAYRRAAEVAVAAVAMQDYTLGATHYHATNIKPYWAQGMVRTGQWGRHVFYHK